MSVLYISQDGTAPSGISTYGFHVLEALADARMLLLNATQPPMAAPTKVTSRIRCVPENVSHDVRVVARELRVLVDSLSGDVVVLPNTGDTPWAGTVGLVRGLDEPTRDRVRVLGIVHSDVETQYAGAVRHAEFAGAWIGVSRRCADELSRRLAGGSRTVHMLPYPMPVASRCGDADIFAPVHLVYSGRLEEPQKRVSRLAAMFHALAVRGVEFRATIAGDGPARRDLAAAIARGPAAAKVTLVGPLDREALARLFECSDLFVLTSAYEGLPLALLEAMAAGVCPVVMQMDSAVSDVLEPDENAVVVPQGDIEAAVAAIAELARDRRRLHRLKRTARDRIARDFAPAKHFSRFDAIVQECFRQPSPDPDLVGTDPTLAAIDGLVLRAREKCPGRPVAVYGAGMFGRKVVDACLDGGISVVAWFDSDPACTGRTYRGLVCQPPEQISSHANATFLVGSLEFAGQIAKRIQAAVEAEKMPPPVIVSALRGSFT